MADESWVSMRRAHALQISRDFRFYSVGSRCACVCLCDAPVMGTMLGHEQALLGEQYLD